MTARKIPGVAPGIFFFVWLVAGGGAAAGEAGVGVALRLAEELFAEGDWGAARVECWRVVEGAGREEAVRARVLAAICMLRLSDDAAGAVAGEARRVLAGVWRDEGVALEVRCLAAYEAGRAEWAAGERAAAVGGLKFAWESTGDIPLFWRAGASLYVLLRGDGELRRQEAWAWFALQSCRDAWPPVVWRDAGRPARGRGVSVFSLPGRAVVGFYRAMISPAIGARCDLEPSCSEYFKQASGAHGLLGIPMMADRFVREPSVVSARERPVVMPDGRIRYADPLGAHDFWLK